VLSIDLIALLYIYIWFSNGATVKRLKDDDEGSLTMDMELMEFSGILKTSACSKACWIGAVNLLEAAAAGEYSVRRRMYCKYSSNWDGGWKDGIPGQVCYFLDKRIRDRAQSLNERWVVVFHAGNVFESRLFSGNVAKIGWPTWRNTRDAVSTNVHGRLTVCTTD